MAGEIRGLNPLLFQRFDDVQIDRLLRAMPFLRHASSRYRNNIVDNKDNNNNNNNNNNEKKNNKHF